MWVQIQHQIAENTMKVSISHSLVTPLLTSPVQENDSCDSVSEKFGIALDDLYVTIPG
jgi:hypothetical protein